MMDMGYVVIAIFVGIIGMGIWSWRKPAKRKFPGGTANQPGRRQEGAHLMRDSSGDGGGLSD